MSLAVCPLPRLVVTNDPDSSSSALAWAVLHDDGTYRLAGVDGGGSRRVTWQTITGARAWMVSTINGLGAIEANEVDVIVETQAPSGPQSADCEELRRVRYHWQAACELDGYGCVFADPNDWERVFLRGEIIGRGAGARKIAYQRRAKALTSLATNEDRCAAIGMLYWYIVDQLGATIDFDRV